jgi:hypothetical protein
MDNSMAVTSTSKGSWIGDVTISLKWLSLERHRFVRFGR